MERQTREHDEKSQKKAVLKDEEGTDHSVNMWKNTCLRDYNICTNNMIGNRMLHSNK